MPSGTNQKFKFTYLKKITLSKTDDEIAAHVTAPGSGLGIWGVVDLIGGPCLPSPSRLRIKISNFGNILVAVKKFKS